MYNSLLRWEKVACEALRILNYRILIKSRADFVVTSAFLYSLLFLPEQLQHIEHRIKSDDGNFVR